MIRVRSAVADDVPWILEQLRAFDAAYHAPRSLYPREDYAQIMLRQLIDVGPFWVAEHILSADPEEHRPYTVSWPVGFIAGMVSGHWMNPEIQVLTELLWWVDPQFRGTRAAALLLEEFVAFGREHCEWIICAIGRETQVNPRALERHGFEAFEQNYLFTR